MNKEDGWIKFSSCLIRKEDIEVVYCDNLGTIQVVYPSPGEETPEEDRAFSCRVTLEHRGDNAEFEFYKTLDEAEERLNEIKDWLNGGGSDA